MSLVVGMLASVAAKVGAPLIKNILQKHIGNNLAGSLAGRLVDEIASKAGVAPDALETVASDKLEQIVKSTEEETPELIALWQKGVEGQFDLLQSDEKYGFLNIFWRSGWMYLLGFFWIWRIVVVPICNAYGRQVEAVDYSHLLTLTGWFMALYMGGHTLKEIGKNVTEAVAKRKGIQS